MFESILSLQPTVIVLKRLRHKAVLDSKVSKITLKFALLDHSVARAKVEHQGEG